MEKKYVNYLTVDFIKNTCPLITNSNVLGNDDDIDLIEPDDTKNDDKIGLVCSNCKLHLIKGKVPPLSLAHRELRFPEIPPELHKNSINWKRDFWLCV